MTFGYIALGMVGGEKYFLTRVASCRETESAARVENVHNILRQVVAGTHFRVITFLIVFGREQRLQLFIGDIDIGIFF
jgi:hypothetical protein